MRIKNKRVIIVSGERRREAAQVINFVLKQKYSVLWIKGFPGFFQFLSALRKEVIIIEDDLSLDPQKLKGIISKNSLLLVTEIKSKTRIKKILAAFPSKGFLVMDFSIARRLKGKSFKRLFTFGIERKKADFYVSNISKGEEETNFKVNYKGNIIPFWTKGQLSEKEVYGILSALCVGEIFRINLSDISQRIRDSFYFTER